MLNINTVPSIGALIGTHGSDDLLNSINAGLSNSNFFGSIDDILNKGRQMFTNNFVAPIRALGNTIKNTITAILVPDVIIEITEEDLLRAIPTCMHDPIMAYAPVKELFEQGRIFGFGMEFAPTEDPWGRLIDNGRIEDIEEAMDKNGMVTFVNEWHDDDPKLTLEELDKIEATRKFIDHILRDTTYDPTDFPAQKG